MNKTKKKVPQQNVKLSKVETEVVGEWSEWKRIKVTTKKLYQNMEFNEFLQELWLLAKWNDYTDVKALKETSIC